MDDPQQQPPQDPANGSGGSWKYPVGVGAVVLVAIGVRGFRGDALDFGLALVGVLGAVGLMALDRAIG